MDKFLRMSFLASVFSCVLFVGLSLFPTQVSAKNPPATAFPPELVDGGTGLTDVGKVSYWIEQCRDYGTAIPKYQIRGTIPPEFDKGFDLVLGDTHMTCAATSHSLWDEGIIHYANGHQRAIQANAITRVARDEMWSGEVDNSQQLLKAGGIAPTTNDNGQTVAAPPAECDVACMVGRLPGMLFSGLGFLLLTLSSIVLGIAGTVFNWVIIRTVFQFAIYFGTSPGMIVAWGVLRDIANIGLLFAFIFMGIATILNTQVTEGFTAKKALPSLIIFAVLLNFSLFATQGIIDVSNGLSSIFSSYAGTGCEGTTSGANGVNGQSNADCASNIGISSKVLEAAGMHQIIPSGDQALTALTDAWNHPYTYSVMLIVLSIMVTVTAMVLIAASIMLVIRVVVLSLLMVTSPIGFAGMAIPGLHKIAHDWWHKLINQAFFAPVYLLMIFISLKLVDTLQEGQATVTDAILGNTAAAGATTAGNMQVVMVFMIVIGFMIAALMVAQKMGAYGASFATKTAGGIAFGAHGFVARRTVGRMSGAAAAALSKTKFAESELGRLAVGAAKYGSTASFSSRNLVGGALKGVGGVDIGKANKVAGHGYHGIEEKAEKERLDYAKTLRDRKENDTEYEARMTAHKAASEKNARDMSAAEAAIPLAEEEKARAEEHLVARQTALEAQREIAEQNPSDAAAQAALRQEEENVRRANNELTQADTKLSIATKSLASATETRAKLAKESAEKMTIKGSDRQKAYARNIEHEGDLGTSWIKISAAGHGNHAAAEKILKDANKSDVDKALDALKKKIEDADKKKDDSHEEPAHEKKPTEKKDDHPH